MGPIDLIVHLAGFVAPALAVGLFMALVGPYLPGGAALKYSFWMRAGLLVLVGGVDLGAGLWGFGRDGKMASYGLLVVAIATVQWLMAGSWRR